MGDSKLKTKTTMEQIDGFVELCVKREKNLGQYSRNEIGIMEVLRDIAKDHRKWVLIKDVFKYFEEEDTDYCSFLQELDKKKFEKFLEEFPQ